MNKTLNTVINWLENHKHETESLQYINSGSSNNFKRVFCGLVYAIIDIGYECVDILRVLKESKDIEDRMLAMLLLSLDFDSVGNIDDFVNYLENKHAEDMSRRIVHAIRNAN